MTNESNLPPNLNEGFNDDSINYKICTRCKGMGIAYNMYNPLEDDCPDCKGFGVVEITPEDKEDEQEKNSGLYHQ